MQTQKNTTKEKIIESAKLEFMSNGFSGASLRTIAKGAGVTTGALYRHFEGKADLFDTIVAPSFHGFIELFRKSGEESFLTLEAGGNEIDWSASETNLLNMIEYIYHNLEAFKLLLRASEKTVYEDFVHMLIDMEVEMTERYMARARHLGHSIKEVSREELHLFINAQFSTFFELVLHEVPHEEALKYTASIYRFFAAGWREMFMGI